MKEEDKEMMLLRGDGSDGLKALKVGDQGGERER